MRDIAEAAGVSVQTVFGQGSKASLLLACVGRAVVGDDERSRCRRERSCGMLAARTRSRSCVCSARLALPSVPQTGPMLKVFATAAAVDPEIATAWATTGAPQQDYRAVVESFGPWLREGLTVDRAADIFWAVFDHGARSLVDGCGWTLEEYCDWLVDASSGCCCAENAQASRS